MLFQSKLIGQVLYANFQQSNLEINRNKLILIELKFIRTNHF